LFVSLSLFTSEENLFWNTKTEFFWCDCRRWTTDVVGSFDHFHSVWIAHECTHGNSLTSQNTFWSLNHFEKTRLSRPEETNRHLSTFTHGSR
jgi:hypothetical protein